jgi:hypothetical protein
MGSSGSSASSTRMGYSPYLEGHHYAHLWKVWHLQKSALNANPYDNIPAIKIDEAFFGNSLYINSFPSLYDMYGKFIAGLDIEALYNQIFNDTINSSIVDNMIASERSVLDERLKEVILPRFKAGMRDINSVISSSFVIGEAMLETINARELNKFTVKMKTSLIPAAEDRWKNHLNWNQNVIEKYMKLTALYFDSKIAVDLQNQSTDTKNVLWPFTVTSYHRAAIGALTGLGGGSGVTGASGGTKGAISGALSGASAGANISGNAWGAVIGAVIGGVGGYYS